MLWKLLAITLMALGLTFAAACGDDDDDDNGRATADQTTAPADATAAPADATTAPSAATDQDTNAPTDDGSTTVDVTASDFSFSFSTISAVPGSDVTVELTNEGDAPHTFTVDDPSVNLAVSPGGTGSVTFTMPAADTRFYCSVHPDLMEGTLVPGDSAAAPAEGDEDLLDLDAY